jgi:hypothetical protein
VGYNRKKFICHPEIVLRCIPQQKKSSSVVSHNGGKPSPLYPTPEKTLPLYPTTEKTFSVVSHSGKKRTTLMASRKKISAK